MKPFPFQQQAIDKLSQPKITSRLIGDDMGLGKTVTAIYLDKETRNGGGGKTLILAPLAVHASWVKHIQAIVPSARVEFVDPKSRGKFVRALKDPKVQFYVLHYEGLRILAQELQKVEWLHIIADEVHRVKNRKAQATRALKSLKAKYKTGLSGTPADDKPEDLWSIINWLWPKYYSSYWKFIGHYCLYDTEQNWGNGQAYRKFVGVQNAQSLHNEMEPWFVRRLKDQVLTDLPDKYYTDVWVDLHPQQRRAYEQMKNDMIAWLDNQDQSTPVVAPVVIAQLCRLQQFALGYMSWDESAERYLISDPSAKLDALMSILEDNPNEQVVVFSQFKSILTLLSRRLAKAKIPHGLYTGDMKKQERDKVVADFQKGKLRVFAGTIAAGGEGITLTSASTMVFLDRSWKPTANRQAEDRLHRIGQKNAVQIIDIMAKDTVDLGRRQRIQQKWTWIRDILGDAGRVQQAEELELVEQ